MPADATGRCLLQALALAARKLWIPGMSGQSRCVEKYLCQPAQPLAGLPGYGDVRLVTIGSCRRLPVTYSLVLIQGRVLLAMLLCQRQELTCMPRRLLDSSFDCYLIFLHRFYAFILRTYSIPAGKHKLSCR